LPTNERQTQQVSRRARSPLQDVRGVYSGEDCNQGDLATRVMPSASLRANWRRARPPSDWMRLPQQFASGLRAVWPCQRWTLVQRLYP